jgi:hypothetical protein
LSAAAGLLQGAHAVIAMRRGPHWLLNDADAKAYGLALANALRHLPVTMAQKYVDFAALGIAIFAYEGPRIGIDMQLKRDRQQQRRPMQTGPAQVFQFRPNPPAPDGPVPPAPAEGPMTYEPDFAS